MKVLWRLVAVFACVGLAGCRAEPQGDPEPEPASSAEVVISTTAPKAGAVSDDLRITMEQAIALVQQVPGAKAHSLGVQSPDAVVQTVANAAAVDMVIDAERMTMRFAKQGGQWAWIGTTSSSWPGENKSPAQVMAWLGERKR